jgi:hypothetical protein
MSSPGRGWTAACLLGIALWIGVTVLVTVLNDDPSDGTPTLLAFAAGGAVFFGAVFGYGLWRTRPRSDPELDLLLDELAIEPRTSASTATQIGAMRRVARVYLVLGAVITALGLFAILEQGLGFGSVGATIGAIVVITVLWALAIPFVLRRAQDASVAVLAPLGLEQHGAEITGQRHGRRVTVSFTGRESVTNVGEVELRSPSDEPAGWLRDLAEAERRADA